MTTRGLPTRGCEDNSSLERILPTRAAEDIYSRRRSSNQSVLPKASTKLLKTLKDND
jgi:hypothetical protein